MENFEKLVARVENMLGYEMSKKEIHDQLASEGVSEDLIFFAFHAANVHIDP